MLTFIRPSLQVKLLRAFILVMLIPTVVIVAYTLLRSRGVLISQISTEQLQVAEARASAAEGHISEDAADLLVLVLDPALRRYARGEPDALDGVAASFGSFLSQRANHYSGACLLDSFGRELVCVRNQGHGLTLVPAAELQRRHREPYFLGALQQAGIPGTLPVIIHITEGTATTASLLRYALRYPNEKDNTAGVIVIEAPLAPILAELAAPEDGISTYVLDQNGHKLFSQNAAEASPGGFAANLLLDQPNDAQVILRQEAGTLIDTADRPGWFQTFTRVRPLGQSAVHWTIIYERPLSAILSSIYETQLVIGAITLFSLLIALIVSQRLASSIVRPIRALAAAAERVGAGDLMAHIPILAPDEVGALANTLEHTVARLRESLATAEQRRHEAETLHVATKALGSTLDRWRVLDLILSELRKVVPYDSASVQEVHGTTSEIISCYGMEQPETILGTCFSLELGQTPNAEVVHTRAPVIIDDVQQSYPIFQSSPYCDDPIRAWMGVPMIFGDRLVGMITLDRHQPGTFTDEYGRLALAFATQAAAAMENARLYEAARRELEDRRRAEAAHARLAAIIEATTDLVSMADLSGRILFLNQSGRRILGLNDEDLSWLRVADLFPERMLPWLRGEALPTVMREGFWIGESIVRAKDGSEIPVSQVILLHRASNDGPALISTIVRDMRERRRAEEELRQAQKMEALGRLSGGLAHDFNNLLTVILGEIDLLEGDLPSDHEGLVSIKQIRHSGLRAATLTRQLLAFSRRQVLQPELLSLNQVLQGMEQMLRRLVGEQIDVQFELAPDLAVVRADPGQIEQVVLNLALNARDAMPQGGHLRFTTLMVGPATGMHSCVPPGNHVLLEVHDTGVGMEVQIQPHIFEPFFTTKPRGQGTGLGLASVHGIVRQSGGQICFESVLNEGTIFRIYLPALAISPTAPPEHALGPVHAPAPVATQTILLVEDDADVRKLTRQILLRRGFRVLEAANGPEARELALHHSGPIDLLLTDVVMPGGMNGVQLAVAIRDLRPGIGVLYMSGYTENALIEHSLRDEGAQFLQKPFTPEQLMHVLHERLERA